jgi:hypothetical protein
MHNNTGSKALAALRAVIVAILAGGFTAHAQTQTDTNNLEKENQELRRRLDEVDELLKKEGIKPSSETKDPPVAALTDITFSGFVTASYFYDAANSKDVNPTGYLWNGAMNQFTLNKAQLVIQSPAVNKDNWDAGFFLSLLYGEDQAVNDKSGGGFTAIRQAYVDMNIPIGTGLDFRVGTMTSLLNYESGDGGAVNDNFSQSYQWFYTGNPPAATAQLGYDFNDVFSVKARLQNGLYNGEVGTGSKTFMGGFYIKPDKKTSLAFLGFEGSQNNLVSVGVLPYHLDGGSFIGSRQLMESYNLTFATEADYFHYSGFNVAGDGFPSGQPHGDFWSVGIWLTADLAPAWRLALRAELIDDPNGFGTVENSPNPPSVEGYAGAPGFPGSIYTSGEGQQLTDVTLTLNYKPTPHVKIQPEIRWNHSTVSTALNGKSDQVIVGMGVSYLF